MRDTLGILLVDDSPEDRTLCKRLLSRSSKSTYEVEEAGSGSEGLEKFRAADFDCILLDYNLPDMNGLEFIGAMPAEEATSIIMLTGAGDEQIARQALDRGVSDYLVKNQLETDLLEFAIQSAVRQRRAQEQISKYAEDLRLAKAVSAERSKKLNTLNKLLAESEKELRALNANKNRFFSIISHDLRSPVGKLRDLARLLKDDFDTLSEADLRQFVQRQSDAAEQLYDLVENLLLWSRVQMNQVDFEPARFDCRSLVREVIAQLATQAQSKSISVTNRVDSAVVNSDYNILTFIVRNVLMNAIKFTPTGGTVGVTSDKHGETITLHVRDNGVGIPNEVVKTLFEIDVHKTTLGTAKERGSGLGLLLCKEMVELQGGRIEVESAVNQGTCVSITILQDAVRANVEPGARAPGRSGLLTGQGSI